MWCGGRENAQPSRHTPHPGDRTPKGSEDRAGVVQHPVPREGGESSRRRRGSEPGRD